MGFIGFVEFTHLGLLGCSRFSGTSGLRAHYGLGMFTAHSG